MAKNTAISGVPISDLVLGRRKNNHLFVLFMEVGWTANQLIMPMGSPDMASKILSCVTR
jgi:hypothetical protein